MRVAMENERGRCILDILIEIEQMHQGDTMLDQITRKKIAEIESMMSATGKKDEHIRRIKR